MALVDYVFIPGLWNYGVLSSHRRARTFDESVLLGRAANINNEASPFAEALSTNSWCLK